MVDCSQGLSTANVDNGQSRIRTPDNANKSNHLTTELYFCDSAIRICDKALTPVYIISLHICTYGKLHTLLRTHSMWGHTHLCVPGPSGRS